MALNATKCHTVTASGRGDGVLLHDEAQPVAVVCQSTPGDDAIDRFVDSPVDQRARARPTEEPRHLLNYFITFGRPNVPDQEFHGERDFVEMNVI